LILPEYSLFNEQVITFSSNFVGGRPYPFNKNYHVPISSLSNLIIAFSPESNPEGVYQILTILYL
jgi:hypothetical protein